MSTKIIEPFELFTDAEGDPLEAGFIYIGSPGQDAEANPVAVYYDKELTIPAVQPIRTLAGRIAYSGSPANIYTTGQHSIIVKDKNGVVVTNNLLVLNEVETNAADIEALKISQAAQDASISSLNETALIVATNTATANESAARSTVNEAAIVGLTEAQAGPGYAYALKSELDLLLSPEPGVGATVWGDTEANNGTYTKTGAADAPGWTLISPLSVADLTKRVSNEETLSRFLLKLYDSAQVPAQRIGYRLETLQDGTDAGPHTYALNNVVQKFGFVRDFKFYLNGAGTVTMMIANKFGDTFESIREHVFAGVDGLNALTLSQLGSILVPQGTYIMLHTTSRFVLAGDTSDNDSVYVGVNEKKTTFTDATAAAQKLQVMIDVAEIDASVADISRQVAREEIAAQLLADNPRAVAPWLAVLDKSDDVKIPLIDADYENDRVWQDGDAQSLADGLEIDPLGGYNLKDIPSEMLTQGFTVLNYWSREGHTGTPSGYFFSMTENQGTSAGETSMSVNYQAISDSVGMSVVTRALGASTVSKTEVTTGAEGGLMIVPQSGEFKAQLENGELLEYGTTTTYVAPTQVALGARARTGSNRAPLVNISLTRQIIYAGALTDAQAEEAWDITNPDLQNPDDFVPDWVATIIRDDGSTLFPVAQAQPEKERAWLINRQVPLTDLITSTALPYRLKKAPHKCQKEITVYVDLWRDNVSSVEDPSEGIMFQMSRDEASNSGGVYTKSGAWTIDTRAEANTSGVGALARTRLLTPGNDLNIEALTPPTTTGGDVAGGTPLLGRSLGIIRYSFTVARDGTIARGMEDANKMLEYTGIDASEVTGWLSFGAAIDGTNPLVKARIAGWGIYSGFLTKDELDQVGAQHSLVKANPEMKPIWSTGDSFASADQPGDALRINIADTWGERYPMQKGNQGGRGWNFKVQYYADYVTYDPKFADHIRWENEGGMDIATGIDGTIGALYTDFEFLNFIKDANASFKNPNFIIMEPNSNQAAVAQAGNTVVTAVGEPWVRISNQFPANKPAIISNDGDFPIQYLVAATAPAAAATGTAIAGGKDVTVTPPEDHYVYARVLFAGTTSTSGVLHEDKAFLRRHLELVQLIKDNYPENFCATRRLMQTYAADDAEFNANVANYTLPAALLADVIHISWPLGYEAWAEAAHNKMAAMGLMPTGAA